VSDSRLSIAETAAAYIARADADFNKNLITESIGNYRRALDLLPRNAHALHRLGLRAFVTTR
jgi:tetratricopeptide (TPR) repeat protein